LRHTAKNLVAELKKIDCNDFLTLPKIAGAKEDPWHMITVKEVDVHLFLPDVREELDLETVWR